MAPAATERTNQDGDHSDLPDHRAKRVMIDALRGRGARFTRADAIVASGLPDAQAERALTLLLKEYRSHLSATDSGELLYEFDPSFVRRDAVTWRERGAAVGRALWKGFSFLFKITIVATLVGYFALFVAMMVAFLFARSSASDDDDRGFGLDGLLWFWGWDTGAAAAGRRRARLNARSARQPFYKRVFAFVFGPPVPAVDPLQEEKQIVAYIRAGRGRIAAVDLVRLMGWSFPRADEETTRLMANYGGEPEVTEDGVIVYSFKELRKTAEGLADARPPESAWLRVEPAPPLTGNEAGTNALIVFFNGFNLLAPLWIVPAFEMKMHISLANWQVALHGFPMAFSTLFFGIPAARWMKARLAARRRRLREARHQLLRRIFAGGGPRVRDDLAPTPALGAVLDGELVSLGGDVAPEPDNQGRVQYTFPRIERETAAVALARQRAQPIEREAGAVVFSSAE